MVNFIKIANKNCQIVKTNCKKRIVRLVIIKKKISYHMIELVIGFFWTLCCCLWSLHYLFYDWDNRKVKFSAFRGESRKHNQCDMLCFVIMFCNKVNSKIIRSHLSMTLRLAYDGLRFLWLHFFYVSYNLMTQSPT